MGDDIEMGAINEAGAQTNLFGQVNPDGTWPGDVVLNVEAKVLAPSIINGIRAVGQGPASPGGIPVGGIGVFGIGDAGVIGQGQRVGVFGGLTNQASALPPTFDNAGVLGTSFGDKQAAGVIGESDVGYGLYGSTNSGVGARGDSNNVGVIGTGSNVGVLGESNGTAVFALGGATGVQGTADVRGTGVLGTVTGGTGVRGVATDSGGILGVGVVAEGQTGAGVAASAGGIAVQAVTSSYIGVYASSTDDNGKNTGVAAGYFDGPVIVTGDLHVLGAKHAAMRQRDGSHRMLYAVESPESWFEDFGQGKLVKGKAKVKLEPGFASVINADLFHVFLTPYGDSNGLYVSQRSKKGFEVREQGNGKANLSFSYRIVAKRKDIRGERLQKVVIPKVKPIKIARPAPADRQELPARPKRRA